ncbi:MAG TPA: tRNA uridine-5-carboxymethylaminomethyl(34) synthesis GTPase MnmE [Alphaproteobacteria bacterium]|nr:tRNA uridine-5-carboxymethylaminomethyl(34) synthesis GTPase MnmE [Alphaproteobacteria bacterium]
MNRQAAYQKTIFALASGSMRAGVAVIRVSGAAALASLRLLADKENVRPRHAYYVTLRDGEKTIDRALAVYFKGPASFTGEDVVEYHVHGGRSVIESLLAALGRIDGCILAEPGEFTRRAFENGKLDLTEAEAIADLIDAETEAQRLQALSQLGGALAVLYQGWTDKLSGILAHQEADIEFPEDDLPQGLSGALMPQIEILRADIAAHLDDNRRGERLRSGVMVAIIGAPNAGKSSLLNALARRDAAIVSDEAGTTRDVIEVHLDLGGYPAILADTAGLRDTAQQIEAEGIRRAQARAQEADLKIALFDGTQETPDAATAALVDDKTVVALSKADLGIVLPMDGFALSVRTGQGMEDFIKELTRRMAGLLGSGTGAPALTRQRHRSALEEAQQHLVRAQSTVLPELAAEDLRMALRALGRITGRVHVEELLDKIFRDFCIGK